MAREFCERGSLTVWGAGSRMMQYVYIDDVIAYMIHGLGIEPGLYNLGGNEYVSISKTATVIAAFFKAEVCYLRDKKEGETLPFMDNEKLKRATGVDIYAPLADALRRYLVDLPCPVS